MLSLNAQSIRVGRHVVRRDGRPWLPVSGEFHFSRYPAAFWRRELLMMKAGGIDLVATYLFWNHHEEVRGHHRFDGDRDVRRFIELCAELGLSVVARIGPWSHGECRNGGFPDWLSDVDCEPRTDDPAYLRLVQPYYAAIARQLKGLWWDDGGPIVGLQVENELRDRPGHLATLRALAEGAGFSAPLWTATAWDGARLPPELLPVHSGYPEAFWEDASAGWARDVRRHYFPAPLRGEHARHPHITCELGGGMAIAYHRRPLIRPADVSALALCQLASGSVWQGYYLYHGCSQRPANQESHATGYPNDLPAVNYDFQAPLGEYGQVRPSFAALRLQHLFLRDCGAELATAAPQLPVSQPVSLDDRATLRWSVRWGGATAFLFVNNHQPHERLPAHGVRFEVVLGERKVRLPAVTVPSGAHFVWPLGYHVGSVELAWATAMPVGRTMRDGVPTAVFVATAGITPRFAFPAGTRVSGAAVDGEGVVTVSRPGPKAVVTATTRAGAKIRLLVLDEANGLRLQWLPGSGSLGERRGPPVNDSLVLCDDPVVADGGSLWVETTARQLDVSFLLPSAGERRLTTGVTPHVPSLRAVRTGAKPPPARTGGPRGRASAPLDEDFAHAAIFHVDVPGAALAGDDEVLLVVGYTGDVARAYVGGRLVADHFWYGPEWEIGLRRFAAEVREHGVEIRVLPRPAGSAVHVDPTVRAQYQKALRTASVDTARLVRRTRVQLRRAPT